MPDSTQFSGQLTGINSPPSAEKVSAHSGSAPAELFNVNASGEPLTVSGGETSLPEQDPPSGISDLSEAAADLAGPGFEIIDLSQRYDIQAKIGGGGMGDVFRGHDRKMQRPVAIKRLKAEFAQNVKLLQRFVDEARTVSHAHIVLVYDYGRDAEGPFLILEFIDGESLADRLKRGPLELDEALRLLIPVCEAVAFAHKHNVIHRDIKPANILISSTGTAKLSDFGIATPTASDQRQTKTGSVMGTFGYMSPEQSADSTRVDGRSDLWSLACTFYEALTGRSPQFFDAEAVPEAIRAVLVRARQFSPANRHASVDEFITELRSAMTGDRPASQREELQEGECRSCHTVNRLDRKFCKKTDCGAPLYEPCPSCRHSSPVWEPICGECGTNIPKAWSTFEAEIDSKSQRIDSLAGEYRFQEAEQLLNEIAALEGQKWQEWKTWAADYSVKFQADKREQETLRDRLFQAAQEAFLASDYAEVHVLLQQIPQPLETSETHELAQRARSRLEELNALLKDLRRMVQAKQRQGLRAKVDRVLELSPGDTRVAQLDRQLRQLEERQRQELIDAENRKFQIDDEPLKNVPPTAGNATSAAKSALMADVPPVGHLNRMLADDVAKSSAANLKPQQLAKPEGPRFVSPPPLVTSAKSTTSGRDLSRNNLTTMEPTAGRTSKFKIPKSAKWILLAISIGGYSLIALVAYLDRSHSDKKSNSTASVPPYIVPPTPIKGNGSRAGEIGHLRLELPPSVDLPFVWCPAGSFKMGSPPWEADRSEDEALVDVELSKGFWIAQTEVTQDMYQAITGTNPSVFKGVGCPVENISWEDANLFCEKLTRLSKGNSLPPNWEITLPTEAQWEYACRAGTTTAYSFGSSASDPMANGDLASHAWYDDNSGGTTHEVGKKLANPWGIFDMHGGVSEWCRDKYEFQLRGGVNPTGPSIGPMRVIRGGSWYHSAKPCRSAHRSNLGPATQTKILGFRLCIISTGPDRGGATF